MVIGFLLASLVVAQKMGATGADTAIAVGQNLRGRLQRGMGNATAGLLAKGGRTVIGGAASALTQNKKFQKFAASKWGGKRVYNAVAGVADSSFDVRKVAGVGKALGIGEGKKGGYTTRLKETAESNKKFQEAMGTTDDAENKAKATSEYKDAKKSADSAQNAVTMAENDVRSRTAGNRTNIKNLNEEMKTASEERKKEIAQEIIANKAIIDSIETDEEQTISTLKEAQKKADKNVQDVLEETTAKIEYSNQILYIETLKKWSDWQKKYARTLAIGAGVVAGVTASVVTGGVLPILGATLLSSGSVVGSIRHNEQDLKSAVKEYGKDGMKKKKAKKKSDELKVLTEQMKDLEKGEKKDKPGEKDT